MHFLFSHNNTEAGSVGEVWYLSHGVFFSTPNHFPPSANDCSDNTVKSAEPQTSRYGFTTTGQAAIALTYKTHIKRGAMCFQLTPAVWEHFFFACTAAFCTQDIVGRGHISRYLPSGEALMSWGELSTSRTQSHMLPAQCTTHTSPIRNALGSVLGNTYAKVLLTLLHCVRRKKEKEQWTTADPRAFLSVKYTAGIICNHE